MLYKIAKIFDQGKPTGQFNIKNNEKTISGRLQISKKINEKYISKTMGFIFFKDNDLKTANFLQNYDGSYFGADIYLTIDKMPNQNETYIKIVIRKIYAGNQQNKKEISNNSFDDDTIPF